jgi:hypothetical protein
MRFAMKRAVFAFVNILLCLLVASPIAAQDRKTKVLNDRDTFANNEVWLYNDLTEALAEAKAKNKPLLVVFRCVPCEACSHFDKQLLDEQEQMRDLLDKFVCVRIVQANGLDLQLFQFDYDQSFHAMFLNADKTIYGRFGTRSDKEEDDDMTMAGFRQAMRRVLDLHAKYPANKEALAGKRGDKVPFAVPEKFPSLQGKYTSEIDYQGNVVASCIHCHQVRDAERVYYRSQGGEMPDHVLFPYPLPSVIGLTMNPNECATITAVQEKSPAEFSGLRAGDKLLTVDDQPIVSTADLQWVLHRVEDGARLPVVLERDGKQQEATLRLPAGWKRKSNLSWRPTTWDLRRIATGGMLLVDLSEEERRERGIANDSLALRVKHLGEYGEHAAAKNAGFQKNDVIVQIAEAKEHWSETEFIAAALTERPGAKLPVTVLRGKNRVELQLPLR